ncbi:MAG: thiamine pyrophosphate-dependent dehydrogenase E1 component subunit alpha [Planctomycetota bacterium]
MELETQRLIEIYRNMVRSRAFEDLVIALIPEGGIPCGWMSGVGQEGIVGALSTLRESDYATYTHRGAYYFLCRGSDPGRVLAELYGKRTGYCRGKGGRHLADTAHKLFGKSGTVGGHAPIAVGLATAVRIRGEDAVVMSFFGDGASNRGTTHESMNLAAVWNLPLVWVCENNGYAGVTPVSMCTAGERIADLAGSYSIPGRVVDGNDVLAVFEAAQEAVDRARRGEGPSLVELETYRVREFAEGGWFPSGYQDPAEVERWKQRDPIDRFRARLLSGGVLSESSVAKIDDETRQEMQAARQFAEKSEFPPAEEAFADLYA